jgi:tripartite-type tricarboxylate transporter receptor subunit TctC
MLCAIKKKGGLLIGRKKRGCVFITNPNKAYTIRRVVMKKKTGSCMAAILVLVMCIFFFSVVDGAVAAEKYPSRPITMVVPFAAGGMSSQSALMWKPFMEKYLPGTVIVEHKPGGGTVIGNTYVASSKPDGYTLLNSSDWCTTILNGTATYKLEDLVPVAQVALNGTVLTVSADAPWKTFQEFVDYARKNPGMKYSHAGAGSANYLRAVNLVEVAGLKMIPIPSKGDADSIPALLGKHVPVAFTSPGTVKPHVEAGTLRVLFSFDSAKEFGLDPSIPNFATLFPKAQDIVIPIYLSVPAKTPKEIMDVLEKTMEKMAKDPEFIKECAKFNQMVQFVPSKVVSEGLPKRMELLRQLMKKEGLIK